jgi:TrmH family RNA methyltransferase
MREVISSENNDRVKYLKKLYRKRQRKDQGKYILEGYRIIDEALQSRAEIDTLYITPEFAITQKGKGLLARIEPDKVVFLEERLLNKLADTATPQGIIAIAIEQDYKLEDLFGNSGLILVLDRLQDPGNMGTIIRTAVAAGADGIITLKGSVDIYNLKVLRATMGAIFNIPIITNMEFAEFKEIIRGKGKEFLLVSTDTSGERYYTEYEYNKPVILVVGNEANGIRKEILKLSNLVIKIPIIGQIDSLNAAVAAGIVIYKILEKKNR